MHKVFKGEQSGVRSQIFREVHLPPNRFPKLMATSDIHRRSGGSTKRNSNGEIEISWYQF